MMSTSLSGTPMLYSLYIKPLCQTLSNAFATSKKRAPVGMAAEMLLYNHKMSAKEALDCGFINYIYKTEELQSKVWDKIVEVSKTPQHSLTITKKLLRNSYHNDLLSANAKEIEELNKIWNKGNEYILEVFNKKSKL